MKFLEILFWRKIAPFGGFLRHFAAKLFPKRILYCNLKIIFNMITQQKRKSMYFAAEDFIFPKEQECTKIFEIPKDVYNLSQYNI